jgi:hypothetical protein
LKKLLASTLVRFVFPMVLLALLVGFSGGSAFAKTPSNHHTKHITVPMHAVAPDGTTIGNCGAIEFYVDDDGGGNADFPMLVSSYYGAITALTYNWSWVNQSSGAGHSYGGTTSAPSGTWEIDPEIYTGTGFVTGSISATEITGGKTCDGSESDYNTIT